MINSINGLFLGRNIYLAQSPAYLNVLRYLPPRLITQRQRPVQTVEPTPRGTGERAPHSLLQMTGHGGTVSRRTANKKLTKLF